MENKSMQMRVILIVVIVFLAGFLAGIGSTAIFLAINKTGPPFFKKGGHFRNPARAIEMITRDLTLNSEQEAAVAKILERAKSDIHELRTATRPKVQEIQARTKQEIVAVLNDEQRKEFEEAYEDFQQHDERRKRAFDQEMMPPRPESSE